MPPLLWGHFFVYNQQKEEDDMLIGQFSESYPPVLDGVGEVVFDYVHELRRLGDDCYAIVSGELTP